MSVSPERVASFVLKFIVAPAILAAVGYYVVGPAVGRLSVTEKSSSAELAPLKEEASKVAEAAEAVRKGDRVSPPSGTKASTPEPDVDVTIEKEGDEAPRAPVKVPATPPATEKDPAETIEVPAEVDIKPAKPKPDVAKPKPPTKPKPANTKPKDKPAQKLPNTPEVGDGGD